MSALFFSLLCYAFSRGNTFSSPVRLIDVSQQYRNKARLSALLAAPLPHEEIPLLSAFSEVLPPIKERFFFPGHSGGEHAPKALKKLYGSELFNLDLPELDGLDNIHSPEGPLLRALQLASDLFGSSRSWFLVNGSTSGILSAVLAAVQIHQRRLLTTNEPLVTTISSDTYVQTHPQRSIMILGRDSHKASFDGLRLADCDGALLPCVQDREFGVPLGVDLDSITEALEIYGSQVCGVLLTRPSYEGVMCSSSRLKEIVKLCHSKGVPVIVDEAHGSHLRFLGRPEMLDAVACGADIVVQSTHKTLTALSQAAMMHLGNDAFSFSGTEEFGVADGVKEVDVTDLAGDVLQDCFSMLTTTSPNAVLLASLDATRAQMAGEGVKMIRTAAAAADEIRYELRQQNLMRDEEGEEDDGALGGVLLLDDSLAVSAERRRKSSESEVKCPSPDSPLWLVDPLRLTVRFPGRSALDADDKMCEERGIFCELNLQNCIVYGIPPGSTFKSLKTLRKALLAEGEAEVPGASSSEASGVSSVILGNVTYLDTNAAKSRRSVPIRLLTEFDMVAAVGRISAETICPYPPGIPVLIKGERITLDHLSRLTALQDGLEDVAKGRKSSLGSGCTVTGCADQTLLTLRVIVE